MTEREFIEGIAMLCATVGKEMPAEQIKSWRLMFDDLTGEQFKAGIVATVRSYTFAGFPPVGVIRENCGAKSGTVATKDRPLIAWGDVRRAISRVGGYDSPNFEDPLIHAVIWQLGGWPALCDATTEELVWREKDFRQTYAAMMQMNVPDEQLERLAGIAEKENGPCFPALIVDVGCLAVGTSGEHRRVEEPESKRIGGPSPAAALATKLEFDHREEKEILRLPVRSKDDQLAMLARMRG